MSKKIFLCLPLLLFILLITSLSGCGEDKKIPPQPAISTASTDAEREIFFDWVKKYALSQSISLNGSIGNIDIMYLGKEFYIKIEYTERQDNLDAIAMYLKYYCEKMIKIGAWGEIFSGIIFEVKIPAADGYGNRINANILTLHWKMSDLYKINYDDLSTTSFLNFSTPLYVTRLGKEIVSDYANSSERVPHRLRDFLGIINRLPTSMSMTPLGHLKIWNPKSTKTPPADQYSHKIEQVQQPKTFESPIASDTSPVPPAKETQTPTRPEAISLGKQSYTGRVAPRRDPDAGMTFWYFLDSSTKKPVFLVQDYGQHDDTLRECFGKINNEMLSEYEVVLTGLVTQGPDGFLSMETDAQCQRIEPQRPAQPAMVTYNYADLRVFKEGNIEIFKNQEGGLVTGLVRKYYKSGKLESEIPVKNGRREGVSRAYFNSNGKLYWQTTYSNGLVEGIDRSFYDTGSKRYESAPYLNGKRNGTSREWHKNGQLSDETVYANDKKNGLSRKYDENSVLLTETVFNNGEVVSEKAADAPSQSAHISQIKPSFDCSKATTMVEIAICSDPGLAHLDVGMVKIYTLVRDKVDKKKLTVEQRAWIKELNDQCSSASDINQCIRGKYTTRIQQLGQQLVSATAPSNR